MAPSRSTIVESCCCSVGDSRARKRGKEGLEGRRGVQRHTWGGVRRGSLMPEIENTIENEMNEKLGLVKKEQIRRRFFKKPFLV